MASLYKRTDSIFWWIRSKDGLIRESTGLRYDSPAETRKARDLCMQWSLREDREPAAKAHHAWDRWVPQFIAARYAHAPKSLSRMQGVWRTINTFLAERKIITPRQLLREHCLQYVDWRTNGKGQGHSNSKTTGRRISRNTVVLETKILSTVMTEAVHRGYVEFNPAWRLGLRREPAQIKGELSDEHVNRIREAIAEAKAAGYEHAEFLHVSFEVALAQGWRLSETHFALENVDFNGLTAQIVVKGRKTEVRNLNPAIVPLLRKLLARGQTHTYRLPNNPPLVWFKVFDALRQRHPGFGRVSFHSTRVTAISRMERAGVPEAVVMKLVGHSSTTVHRVYRRVQGRELAQAWAALGDGTTTP